MCDRIDDVTTVFSENVWGQAQSLDKYDAQVVAQLYDFMHFRKRHFTLLLLMSGPVRRDLPTLRGAAFCNCSLDFRLLTREEGADPTLPDVIVADPGPPVLLCSRLLKLVFGPYL